MNLSNNWKKDVHLLNLAFKSVNKTIGDNYIVLGDKGYGVVFYNGRIIIPTLFLDIKTTKYESEDAFLAIDKLHLNTGIIYDISGNQLTVIELDQPEKTQEEKDIESTLRLIYSSLRTVAPNRIIAEYNGQFGVIDSKGQTIIPFEYRDMEYSNGTFKAFKYFDAEYNSILLLNMNGESVDSGGFTPGYRSSLDTEYSGQVYF